MHCPAKPGPAPETGLETFLVARSGSASTAAKGLRAFVEVPNRRGFYDTRRPSSRAIIRTSGKAASAIG
jgi:hypothetical protein